MAVRFKRLCIRCKERFVPAIPGQKYSFCYECQKKELDKPIKDPKMKKLFKIPEKFYKKSPFLRNIKINYLTYGGLTEKQIEAFKKTVKKTRKKLKEEAAKQ